MTNSCVSICSSEKIINIIVTIKTTTGIQMARMEKEMKTACELFTSNGWLHWLCCLRDDQIFCSLLPMPLWWNAKQRLTIQFISINSAICLRRMSENNQHTHTHNIIHNNYAHLECDNADGSGGKKTRNACTSCHATLLKTHGNTRHACAVWIGEWSSNCSTFLQTMLHVNVLCSFFRLPILRLPSVSCFIL